MRTNPKAINAQNSQNPDPHQPSLKLWLKNPWPLSTNSSSLVERGTHAKFDFRLGGLYCLWVWEKTGEAAPFSIMFLALCQKM